MGACLPLERCYCPTCVTIPTFDALGHLVIIVEIPRKFWPLRPAFQGHSRLLESTPIDRPPMTTYYCPIASHGPCPMGLSHTISKVNSNFCRQSQTFVTPVYLTSPLREFPWQFCNGGSSETTRVMPLPERGERLAICAFVSIQYQRVSDIQTDRQTDRLADKQTDVP